MEVERGTSRDRGFTLIELLIVIVVLGVLATVTVFAVRGMTADAEEASCAEDLKAVETAVELWLTEHPGTTVVTEDALVDDGRLRSESDGHDVAPDGSVVSVGRCEAYAPAPTSSATTVAVAPPTTADTSGVPTSDVPTTVAASLASDWVLVSGSASSPTPAALSIPTSALLLTSSPIGDDQTVSATFSMLTAGNVRVRLAASANGDGYSVRFYPGGQVWVRVRSNGISCWSSLARVSWPSGVSTTGFPFSARLASGSLTVDVGGSTVISIPDLAAEVASRCGSLPLPTGRLVAVQTYAPAELTGVSVA